MADTVWCETGWFKGSFYYGFCPNEKAWKKTMKKFGVDRPYPNSAGLCTFLEDIDGRRTCLITIKDGLEESSSALEMACLIVHEAVHVWQELTDVIGEEAPSAEFEAYSIQAISQELIHAFEKTRRPLDKCGKEE